MKHAEISKQKELAKWFRAKLKPLVEEKRPEVKNLRFVYTKNEGSKGIIEATQDKLSGIEKGHPDIYISYVIGDLRYIHYMELKTTKGKLNDSQKEWWANFITCKNSQGAVCNDLMVMQNTILEWLELK